MLRLWNSRDVYEAATGLKDGPCSSQNSDSTLHSAPGDTAIKATCHGIAKCVIRFTLSVFWSNFVKLVQSLRPGLRLLAVEWSPRVHAMLPDLQHASESFWLQSCQCTP